jgi:2-C-methyl-D-erythritol 4-phosphate cytidylyltransferase
MSDFVAVITAGGSGRRMASNKKKQFLLLQGKTVLEHTIERFLSVGVFSRIVVVLPEDEFSSEQTRLSPLFPTLEYVQGGKFRQNSVFNALKYIEKADYVFVHDGVRPFVKESLILKLADLVQEKQAVIPAVPTTNTLKLVSLEQVEKTLKRDAIFGATTPQAFSYDLLKKSYEKALTDGVEFTDDASLLESLGYSVFWLEDEPSNIKITTPFDFLVAETLVKSF